MATITGTEGTVTLTEGPSSEISIYQWTADIRRDIFDDSNFEAVITARAKVGGMADMVGSCRGRAIAGNNPPTIGTMPTLGTRGGTASFVLNVDATHGYTFTGILTSVATSVIKTGVVEVSVGFESTGAVVPA